MNKKIFYWIFFIGLLSSSFSVYDDSFKYGVILIGSIVSFQLIKILFKFLDLIIKKNNILKEIFILLNEYSNSRLGFNNECDLVIDTSDLNYVDLKRYKDLKDHYLKILKNLNIKRVPIVTISQRSSSFKNNIININKKEFKEGDSLFTLGHELAHFYYDDSQNEGERMAQILIFNISIALMIDPIFYLIGSPFLLMSQYLCNLYISRKHEYKADLMGSYFLGNEKSILSLKSILKNTNEKKEYLSTHPSCYNRLQNIMHNKLKLH